MNDIKDFAIAFEAIKVSMRQDKNGYVLVLSIHPNEVPEELLRAWVGSRYQVALVQLDDSEAPVPIIDEGKKAVAKANTICKNERFIEWALGYESSDPGKCAEWLRAYLGVKSRSELATNEAARKKFEILLEEFKADVQGRAYRGGASSSRNQGNGS